MTHEELIEEAAKEIMDRVLIAGMKALGYDVKKPKKTLRWLKAQGEPSGAQVQAALEAYWGSKRSAKKYGSTFDMHAALRAASQVIS